MSCKSVDVQGLPDRREHAPHTQEQLQSCDDKILSSTLDVVAHFIRSDVSMGRRIRTSHQSKIEAVFPIGRLLDFRQDEFTSGIWEIIVFVFVPNSESAHEEKLCAGDDSFPEHEDVYCHPSLLDPRAFFKINICLSTIVSNAA